MKKKERVIVYKVVHERGGKLYSSYVKQKPAVREYKPGVIVRPIPGTPLFAYKSKVDANHTYGVRGVTSPYQLWKCEAVLHNKRFCTPTMEEHGRDAIVRLFDENTPSYDKRIVFCTQIKLLERIA